VARTRTTPRNPITVNAAATRASLSSRTIRRYIALGILPAYRVGTTCIRVDQADVDALIRPLPAASGPDGRGGA
jgi:excisionase family DNA binding protein